MKRIALILATMLCCSTAMAANLLPVEGVYEKIDNNGKVVAKMQVWDAKGSKGREGLSFNNPTNYPYISLQLFENGNEIGQIGTSYFRENDSAGTANMAIVLNREECIAANEAKGIYGERKNEVAGFGWENNNEVNVKNYTIDERYTGTYRRVDSLRELTPAVMIYAYEANQMPKIFYDKNVLNNVNYSFYSVHGPFNIQKMQINDNGSDNKSEYYYENDFNLVIEMAGLYNDFYFFPFIHNNIVNRTEETWGNVNVPGTFTEAAAMVSMRKLVQGGYGSLVPKNNASLRFRDFYSGEGENATSTHRFQVQDCNYNPECDEIKAIVDLSDNGNFRVKNFTGTATVNGTEIRFREAHSLNGRILGEMNNGETVTVYGYENADNINWALVKRQDGTMGYMAMQYLVGIDQP